MTIPDFPILFYILFFTLVGSLFSLIGGIILLWKKSLTEKISHLLISFAAGTLLGTAFFDLLPEASEGSDLNLVLFFTLFGFLIFFILERFIHWMHHHPHEYKEVQKPTVALINIGDAVHNAIDGVAIAATFLVSVPLGIITSIAVATHEIPQEIGDFAIMLKEGIKPKKVIFYNIASASAAVFSASLTYILGDKIKEFLPALIAITAGFFIYISASDLIPEIHENNRRGFAVIEAGFLIFGVFVVWFLARFLE